ncbi:MAG TPA: hypothetical protein PK156_18615 [Polyangium sp.]|nr:hypothetical protein [Polyangium sp.]
MRRDLTRGCAACRLRFSSQLTHCPVCRSTAASVPEATIRIQPTSRAAWLAKWVITISTLPAIGLVLWTGGTLFRQGWPPTSGIEVLMLVFGAFSMLLGAGIVVAMPLALWVGLITLVRWILEKIVDRPRKTLRISIETSPRQNTTGHIHPMHRLWDKLETFVRKQIDEPKTFYLILSIGLIGLEILGEIFGASPSLKFTNWDAFLESALEVGVINVLGVAILMFLLGILGSFVGFCYNFLAKPPYLFGYDPNPPELRNIALLSQYLHDRQQIIGRVAPLEAAERVALGLDADTPLRSPLSGQTCFAFRIVGTAEGQLVDDADATGFAVIGDDQKRCLVTTADVVVYFAADEKLNVQGARGFLKDRGLPERYLELREGMLRESDLVRVVGRGAELRIGSAGYRGNEQRLTIDAGDGLPVVIRGHEEERS